MNRKIDIFCRAVKARDRKGINLCVTRAQILHGCVGDAVVVGAVCR